MPFVVPRRRSMRLLAAVLPAVLGVTMSTSFAAGSRDQASAAGEGLARGVDATRSCASIEDLVLPNVRRIESSAVQQAGEVPGHCAVQIVKRIPGTSLDIQIGVFMPQSGWNQRFLGVGGGGYSSGGHLIPCGQAAGRCGLLDGFSVASTSGGNSSNPGDASWVLGPDGTLDRERIRAWGYQAVHEMTVTAKEVVTRYYSRTPTFSYFSGTSGGGRQAVMSAQRYPHDYDGVAAASPTLNFPNLRGIGGIWPQLVMRWSGNALSQAKFSAVNAAAVRRCDGLDGAKDGAIQDWESCTFRAASVIGLQTADGRVTRSDARVIDEIWRGPHYLDSGKSMWHGLLPGAPFNSLANTEQLSDGTVRQLPFSLAVDWFRYWVERDEEFDWRTLTPDQYEQAFEESQQFSGDLAANDPDLSEFRKSGGKLVVWHGTSDPVAFAQGTIDYYRSVIDESGGQARTRKFARLFVAGGAGHVQSLASPAPAGAYSPAPVAGGALAAVMSWVESGKAPESLMGVTSPDEAGSLNANGDLRMTRPICAYPKVAAYKGRGDVRQAKNFSCERRYSRITG